MIDRINASKTAAGVSALPTWDTESSMESPSAGSKIDAQVCAHIGTFYDNSGSKGYSTQQLVPVGPCGRLWL